MNLPETVTRAQGYDPVLGGREAGAYLNLHYKTVLKLHAAGQLAGVRMSRAGKVGFLLSDLNEFNRARRQQSQIAPPDRHEEEIDWAK